MQETSIFIPQAKIRKNNFTLMCKNEKVLKISEFNNVAEIFNINLVPFYLRNKTDKVLITDVINWLNKKVFNMSRSNAKKIANALNLSQTDSTEYWQYSNALSLTDCYWIQFENENKQWKNINLYENNLDKIVAEIALTGNSHLRITSKVNTPEVLTDGVNPKCWIKRNNKSYLLKGSRNLIVPKVEVEILVSDILDKLEINHIKYNKEDNYSICENMTNLNLSRCAMDEYLTYCSINNINPQDTLSNYTKDFANMVIVDYLINNWDRHGANWGIYYNPNTGKEISLHPLFDHNNSLLIFNNEFDGEEKSLINPDLTMKQFAQQMKPYSSINTNNLILWLKEIKTMKRFQDIFEQKMSYTDNEIVYNSLIHRISEFNKF